MSLGEIERNLKRDHAQFDTINFIYVLSQERELLGVLSVKDLFSLDPNAKAGDVCKRSPLVSVKASTHQERAAYLALKHNIKAVPVVDMSGVFLGEISSDSILSILHKEMHEDTLKRVGITHPDALHATVLTLPLFTSFRHRIPWLFLGLIGGLFAAKIIGFFEQTLSKNLVLASFIPLIVYMSDAVGTQMEAYIIRDLATEQSLPVRRYFLRHAIVVVSIALVLGILLFSSYILFTDDVYMAFVLSVSLIASICSSLCTGLLIPLVFARHSLDPADASGPIATILQDMMSILIYFGIASALL